jgi:hypothetical protein
MMTHSRGEFAKYTLAGEGLELLEAEFDRHMYERHMHEAYAIGVTLRGVQRFWCRGATHDSTAGHVIVIGPGEAHDGESGAPGGYAYRMLYVSNDRVERVLADAGAPRGCSIAVRQPLITDLSLLRSVSRACRAVSRASSSLAAEELVDEALLALASRAGVGQSLDRHATLSADLRRVREYLHHHLDRPVSGCSACRCTRTICTFGSRRQSVDCYSANPSPPSRAISDSSTKVTCIAASGARSASRPASGNVRGTAARGSKTPTGSASNLLTTGEADLT